MKNALIVKNLSQNSTLKRKKETVNITLNVVRVENGEKHEEKETSVHTVKENLIVKNAEEVAIVNTNK